MYTVMRYDIVDGVYKYFNTFNTYSEAVDEAERLGRVYKTHFMVI